MRLDWNSLGEFSFLDPTAGELGDIPVPFCRRSFLTVVKVKLRAIERVICRVATLNFREGSSVPRTANKTVIRNMPGERDKKAQGLKHTRGHFKTIIVQTITFKNRNTVPPSGLSMDKAGVLSAEPWSYQCFMRDPEDQLVDPELYSEGYHARTRNKELGGFEGRQHYCFDQTDPNSACPESPGFIPACQTCEQPDHTGVTGRESCVLDRWVYPNDQQQLAACSGAAPVTAAPAPRPWCPCAGAPAPGHESESTQRSTVGSSSCSQRDPVCAAAHLHLLGESLSLIGLHLRTTDKLVNLSSSCSLLLDSLLCALAPLMCLTAEIPELKSCTQHKLVSTLENIAYVMPGM